MTPQGPVLLCYDGSEEARNAIRVGGRLLGGGPALVLTVWKPFDLSLFRPVSDAILFATGATGQIASCRVAWLGVGSASGD